MKKLVKTIALTSLIATVPTITFAEAPSFKDVSSKNVYHDIIVEMANQSIINGYEDGTFRPNQSITRKHASALINRAVDLPETEEFTQPKDLSSKNANYNDIKALIKADLLEVDGKGNINPNAPLTRGEMAKIISVAFNLEGDKNSLKDVSKGIEPYVSALYENDVTTGYEDGTFREKESLTRSHFAVFMYRAMNIDRDSEVIEADQETKGDEKGLFELTDKEYIKIAEMVDIYAMKKEDVPRPEGVTTEKQNAEQIEIRTRELHNGVGGFGIADDNRSRFKDNKSVYNALAITTGQFIDSKARHTNISVEEFTDIINQIVKTGEVYDSGNFSMYYNYDDGNIYYSDR
ncbi:S-layer homology domain-containing protein [Lysinibacillus telephonicus]|uniref:S-layer homology domain-containing protein n=1 Tax=Lysinibacillus telephonicus TaxID=1714840 RepID=A0A431UY17_9BACI|nr:S-layer homology domain-containing protein [Lysinibacillus telephonicus]RTQ96496.1 S-layer homology domain-containing protein [Lysinibacillus telephonicus]